jgi:fatty-acyl-CoA synthase
MSDRHLHLYPLGSAGHLIAPQVSLFHNAANSAKRWGDKPYLIFYDTPVSFASLHDEALTLAGFLEREWDVQAGDRVLLMLQNSPQYAIAYYGILRANAVVVPVNPMNVARELSQCARDCAATRIIVAQDLLPEIEPLLGTEGPLQQALIVTYSDYLREATSLAVPELIRAPRLSCDSAHSTSWAQMLARALQPGPLTAGPEDLCVLPYTSGTTGIPKGCMHTHRATMHTLVGIMRWHGLSPEDTLLSVAPWFHVTGMQSGMNGPLFLGATQVVLPRWDREAALELIQRYRIRTFSSIPTMVQDLLASPDFAGSDLSSLRRLSGGGAPMPVAVATRLQAMGIPYLEGYGLTETVGATHFNPPAHPKKQCLGIPFYDTEAMVVDPQSLQPVPSGNIGELLVRGPQVMQGYWNRPAETAAAFVDIDGRRFLRTGDLARVDYEGYYFMVDRLKRMINASGYKVWPAEVETLMYAHPAIQEACVIACPDSYRGESVKALVVLRPEWVGGIDESELIGWCREQMARYKAPRIIEFVDALPRSSSGKILWRQLQDRERDRVL